MPTISLTQPTALTVITAGLHATNYATLAALLNGGLDNANIAPGAAIQFSKMSFPGGTTTFLRADGTFASAGGVPAPATTLPGSPTNGQIAVLVDSTTAPTYSWVFRYDTTVSDTYKWVWIGGSPGYHGVQEGGTEETASLNGAYGALTTAGPLFALPVAGIYIVEIGARFGIDSGGGATAWMSYDIGGTGAVDADSLFHLETVKNHEHRNKLKTFATAVTLTCKYKGSSANLVRASNRYIKVTPVRVG